MEVRAAGDVVSLLLSRAASAIEAHLFGVFAVTVMAFVLVTIGVSTAVRLADEGGYVFAAADCFPWFAEGFMLSAVIPAVASLLTAASQPRNANEAVRLQGSKSIRSSWIVSMVGCSWMIAVLVTASVGMVGSNCPIPVSSFGYESGMLADALGMRLEMPELMGFVYAAMLFFVSSFLSGVFASSLTAAAVHLTGNAALGLLVAVGICQANAVSGNYFGLVCADFASLAAFGEPVVRGALTAAAALFVAAVLVDMAPRRDWLGS